MCFIGVLGQDELVPCASCHQTWSVRYLMQALGQHRLRPEGFAYVWFDDAIMVNWCPSCELPAGAPVSVPAIALSHLPMATQVSEPMEMPALLAAA